MSRGPGSVETRIGDLFAASQDRALSVDELAADAFALVEGKSATRAQRLSTIRAAHRVIRRTQEMNEARQPLLRAADDRAHAALGRKTYATLAEYEEYRKLRDADPDWRKAQQLFEAANRIGFKSRFRYEDKRYFRINTDYWRATTIGKGRGAKLWFHAPDVPIQVWAVEIDRSGVHWFEAEVVRITERNVSVRYAGDLARLDREKLWRHWAWWRGVRFVSSRTGYVAGWLDAIWWEEFGTAGSVPPAMQMPLADAITLLGVPGNYMKEDVIAAFRREVKKAHPDRGGTAEMFRKLVEARDRLLAALGTSAPVPKMPAYYPIGAHIVYRARRTGPARLGHTTRRLAHG